MTIKGRANMPDHRWILWEPSKQNKPWRITLCALVVIIWISTLAHAEPIIIWQDSFTTKERQKLTSWISEVSANVETLVGPFPFEVRIQFFRRGHAREPVPWANTIRSRTPGVRFYVDPLYSLDSFRRDWTAAHEISHLILPYLGSQNAWFAEGFASFMQYQVLHTMGVLSKQKMAQRYHRSIVRAEHDYAYPTQPFVAAAPRLRMEGKYSVMYWGGAVYFLQVDHWLVQTRGTTLIDVLKDYIDCCRRNGDDLDQLIIQLDQLVGFEVFAKQMARFQSERGFPEYQHLDMTVGLHLP
ncbi:MAG: hypothetical protein DRR06_02705 [Gammaproteobacteria bacterium]|nr:MAG: hypothetical protein DRR06_02705 [Gammaproteobacteria bacterium]RLA54021.1 MAG: hypothetical protein DRR42_03130 [Gammaproteobacteria bacterium]